ncbi:MAG: DUF4760 domain-containing protein [Proteobacteria bacterium]|nr:DUF4760 domain-containing protein [Pseudomonadota bacterium]
MNRPFLLTIAFAVLVFNANTAWANSTTNIPIGWDVFLSPIAILISAGVAWYVAGRTIKENEIVQRRRVTMTYILRLSRGNDYAPLRKDFLELKAQKINFSKIAEDYNDLSKSNKNNSKAKVGLTKDEHDTIKNHDIIAQMLNEYESMAIAIKLGSYDEDIIKMSRKQIVLSDLRICGSFIGTTRKNLSTKNEYAKPDAVYKECCDLYKKWSGNGLETLS